MPSVLWTVDRNLVIRSSRGSWLDAVGRPPNSANGMTVGDYLRTQQADHVAIVSHRRALAGEDVGFEAEYVGRSFRVFLTPLRDEKAEIVGVSGIAVDWTDEKRIVTEMKEAQELLELAQAAAHLGSWTHDLSHNRAWWSNELYDLCGVPHGEHVTPDSLYGFVHPEDLSALEAALEVSREERVAFAVDTRMVRSDGTIRWVAHRGRFAFGTGGPERVVGTVLDIDARKRAEEHLAYQANYDSLTGLPNRKLLVERLALTILRAQVTNSQCAVLYVDLDRFKQINDTLGHDIGDQFLRIVANRLMDSVREGDIVGRSGGDEFVVVLPQIASLRDAAIVGERIVAAFTQPIEIGSRSLYSSASVGISVFPDDGDSPEALIRGADAAHFRGTGDGRGTFRFYAASAHARAIDRLELEQGIRRAYERNEFFLHYQPIVDRFERPVAVEALLRWNSPERGLVSPDRFIPLCEEIGLIGPLGRWVINAALRQLAEWRAQNLPEIRMALNISGRQMIDPQFPAILAQAISEAGVDPGLVELELTESVIMSDVPAARRAIAGLKEFGVRISLDDFGTGYSTLSYLKHFNVDALKIDRAFVRDLPHDRGDSAIVSAVVALGHAMGLGVVAEGVENAEQAALVRRLGCDEMQGYHFAKPMPSDRAAEVLRVWSAADVRT